MMDIEVFFKVQKSQIENAFLKNAFPILIDNICIDIFDEDEDTILFDMYIKDFNKKEMDVRKILKKAFNVNLTNLDILVVNVFRKYFHERKNVMISEGFGLIF